jgi:hypothetical protein
MHTNAVVAAVTSRVMPSGSLSAPHHRALDYLGSDGRTSVTAFIVDVPESLVVVRWCTA